MTSHQTSRAHHGRTTNRRAPALAMTVVEPVPPVPTGDAPAIATHCPFCAFQCGMTVNRGDETRRLAVRADPAFPVNRGQMCIKGFTSADLMADPGRLRAPRIRASNGRLVQVGWETALDLIADKIVALRDRYGADAIATFGSGALTNEKAYLLGKFTRVVLRSSNIDYNGRYCMASAAAGQSRAFGIDRGLPFPVADIAEAGALMLWGSNCADTMPPIMQWIAEQKARGGALIVVDPRRTETARAATLHLQVTPGTDLALANGLLHLAIEEKLVDLDYIAARTDGFDDVRRSVLTSHPDHVERTTGVRVEDQRRAVRLLAAAGRSMTLSGRGAEQQSKGTDTVLALINLMLALGKVGKYGSGYGCLTGQGNGQGGREHGQKADQLPGYRLIEDPEDRARMARFWGIDERDLPRKGRSAYELLDSLGIDGGVRALLVFGSNVAVASPNATHIARRLRALDLLVVSDAFENETSEAAHVVLPTTQWAEEEGTMTNLEGRVVLRQRVQPPPEGVRTDIEILGALAARLGHREGFAFNSPREVFDELRAATAGAKADYSGVTYERIRAERGVFWPCPDERHPGTPRLFAERFAHPSGRARFHVVADRPAAETPDGEYPLYFTTGRYREHYNSGAQTRRIGALVEAQPEPRVQIHPRLADRIGAGDGTMLVVESRRGAVCFRASLSADIRPDTLFAPFHWGGRHAANILTIAALDPVSRMPEFKVCAVRARVAAASVESRN